MWLCLVQELTLKREARLAWLGTSYTSLGELESLLENEGCRHKDRLSSGLAVHTCAALITAALPH